MTSVRPLPTSYDEPRMTVVFAGPALVFVTWDHEAQAGQEGWLIRCVGVGGNLHLECPLERDVQSTMLHLSSSELSEVRLHRVSGSTGSLVAGVGLPDSPDTTDGNGRGFPSWEESVLLQEGSSDGSGRGLLEG